MLNKLKIKSTSIDGLSLVVKDHYKGYEISIVMEMRQSGTFQAMDVRVYKCLDDDKYVDFTFAFAGLFQDRELDNVEACIDYHDHYHEKIRKIIDVL